MAQHLLRVQGVPADLGGQLYIFQGRQILHQVVELEHEADVISAVCGELSGPIAADLLAVHPDSPAVTGVHPPRMFSTVVLPAPEGPTMTANCPFSISKEMSSTAVMVISPHLIPFPHMLKGDIGHRSSLLLSVIKQVLNILYFYYNRG